MNDAMTKAECGIWNEQTRQATMKGNETHDKHDIQTPENDMQA